MAAWATDPPRRAQGPPARPVHGQGCRGNLGVAAPAGGHREKSQTTSDAFGPGEGAVEQRHAVDSVDLRS